MDKRDFTYKSAKTKIIMIYVIKIILRLISTFLSEIIPIKIVSTVY